MRKSLQYGGTIKIVMEWLGGRMRERWTGETRGGSVVDSVRTHFAHLCQYIFASCRARLRAPIFKNIRSLYTDRPKIKQPLNKCSCLFVRTAGCAKWRTEKMFHCWYYLSPLLWKHNVFFTQHITPHIRRFNRSYARGAPGAWSDSLQKGPSPRHWGLFAGPRIPYPHFSYPSVLLFTL